MNALCCLTLALATLLVSCVPSTNPTSLDANLQGKKWVLLYLIDYSPVPGKENVVDGFRNLTLTFRDNQFAGYDGCNVFEGSYTATVTALSFSELGGTTRGCNAELQSQAEAYFGALEQVATYRTEDDQLHLQNDKGREVLGFSEANATYEMNLQFKSDTNVALDKHSKVRVKVWGYDELVADAASTNLIDQTFDLPNLAVRPVVSFAEEDLLSVNPSSGTGEALRYFVTFAIDVNGDGRVCIGDYRQDYDKTDLMAFTREDVGSQNLNVFIQKIVDLSDCEAF